MISQEEYRAYVKNFKSVERYLKSKSAPADVVAYNICKLREYQVERMQKVLMDTGFMFIEGNDSVYDPLREGTEDLALFSKDGNFLLSKRFIFPVKDMLGNTIALIGWFPDDKKYITTPSKLFSKNCLFYGMEQLAVTGIGKPYFLCEGIFDRLSILSLGLPAVSQMGIVSSRVKFVLYSLFSRLVGIPDNDVQGRDVLWNDKWSLPSNSSYFRWTGDDSKDIDKLINSYEAEDVKEMLISALKNKNERIIKEELG